MKRSQRLPQPSPAKKIGKIRLDEFLVAKGLVESRSQAKGHILAGNVRRGTERLDKAGLMVPANASDISLEKPPRYVSRGGEKLEAALKHFGWLSVSGSVLDIGASTGGFTDCMLQHGCHHATCVDVGYGQLHGKLRSDPRIANLERVNARYLEPGQLPRQSYEWLVADLSFISLDKVIPAVWEFLKPEGKAIFLVKPQFEVSKEDADRSKGVIRDDILRLQTLEKIRKAALELPGCLEIGSLECPLSGAEGNREFLLALEKRLT